MVQPLPSPLQSMADVVQLVHDDLKAIDALRVRFGHSSNSATQKWFAALAIELTYHSNAIEGNTLTLRQTQLVLEGHSPGEGKSLREIDEARNHQRALALVQQLAQVKAKLDSRGLLDVHREVLKDISDNDAGVLRSGRVLIAGTSYIPPGPHRFDELLPRTFELAEDRRQHAVIRAAALHYNLAAIHPFVDGNGRTARLLMNQLLLREGFGIAIVPIEKRSQYLQALDEANHGRTGDFVKLICRCLRDTLERSVD